MGGQLPPGPRRPGKARPSEPRRRRGRRGEEAALRPVPALEKRQGVPAKTRREGEGGRPGYSLPPTRGGGGKVGGGSGASPATRYSPLGSGWRAGGDPSWPPANRRGQQLLRPAPRPSALPPPAPPEPPPPPRPGPSPPPLRPPPPAHSRGWGGARLDPAFRPTLPALAPPPSGGGAGRAAPGARRRRGGA